MTSKAQPLQAQLAATFEQGLSQRHEQRGSSSLMAAAMGSSGMIIGEITFKNDTRLFFRYFLDGEKLDVLGIYPVMVIFFRDVPVNPS